MITAKVRQEVLLSGDCAYCGGVPTQVDHILPRSRGGTDDRSNLAHAGASCNMEKLDFTPVEYREYRESEGLGWPPETLGQTLGRIIEEAKARYGLTDEDIRRMCTRIAQRAYLERVLAADETLTELERLTVERVKVEETIASGKGALHLLLRRLHNVEAGLDALA